MRSLDWDKEFKSLAKEHGCSDEIMRGRPSKKAIKDRRDLEKAFNAVRTVTEKNPDISCPEELRKEVYSFFFPGLMTFLIPILLSVLLKIAIEYLIEHLFSEPGQAGEEELVCN